MGCQEIEEGSDGKENQDIGVIKVIFVNHDMAIHQTLVGDDFMQYVNILMIVFIQVIVGTLGIWVPQEKMDWMASQEGMVEA